MHAWVVGQAEDVCMQRCAVDVPHNNAIPGGRIPEIKDCRQVCGLRLQLPTLPPPPLSAPVRDAVRHHLRPL